MMRESRNGGNGQNRLLASLTPTDLALLSPHLKNIHQKQGVVLQELGDPIEFVYFPSSGMISLLAVMETGNGIETASVGHEGGVGVLVGLSGRVAVARAVVQVEGTISQIPALQFERALAASPTLRELMIQYNDVQIMLVHQVAGCNALHQMSARLCRWLLQTRDKTDTDVIALTHEVLSEMLGVRRSTVTLLARELQSLGLIHYRRGKIEIVDRPGLEARACQCYGTARRRIDDVFANVRQ